MKLEQLQAFFPPERHRDVAALYRRYLAETGLDQDVEGFVADLFAKGLLSADALKEIFAHHEVVLGAPDRRAARGERYRVLAVLGRGAMGEVLLARDPELRRTLALKRLHPHLQDKASATRRFLNEAQITAQLDHPGVVPVYGLETDREGRVGYAMKFVSGQTLQQYIADIRERYATGQPLDDEHALATRLDRFLALLQAMSYAHRRGVLHRDLKPANIMVGAFGEVVVMDWGIARPIGDRERVTVDAEVERTRVGTLVGTPNYMSPEQARGETRNLDARSDQYALGLILFELVTLSPALVGDTQLEVITRAAAGLREPIVHRFDARIPRELAAIIAKATAPDPADRYPSVDAFADDLRRFTRDQPVSADPDRGLRKVSRWIGHHRGLTLALGVSAALIGLALAAFLQWRGAVALQAQRTAAYERERGLQALSSKVVAQASRMSDELARFERLTHGVATVATHALTEPPPDGPLPRVYKYLPTGLVPPDPPTTAEPAPAYGGEAIDVDDADFAAAPEVDLASPQVKRRLRQLAAIVPTLKSTTLRSHSEEAPLWPPARQRHLIRDEGVPILWTYVALEDGLTLSYPGSWTLVDDEMEAGYDAREQPWYKEFAHTHGPIWSSAGVDESGFGILMSCAESIYAADGKLLGVVGVDMKLKYFIDALLVHPDLSGPGVEAVLVDDQGRVVARSSQREAAGAAESFKLVPYEDAAARERLLSSESGHLEGGGRLTVWSRLATLPWTYLVVGPPEALLREGAQGRRP